MLLFLRRRVVSTVFVKLPKIQEKSTPKPPKSTPASCFYWFRSSSLTSYRNHPPHLQNHPQNLQKSILKRPKNHPKSLQNRGLEGIALRIAVGTPIFPASWGPSWVVLAASWGLSWRVLGLLGASWRVLGASWVVFGRSWRRLGSDPKKNQEKSMVLASKIKPQNLKNQAPAAARARFLIFWLTSILYKIPFKNQPKFNQKSLLWASWALLGASWARLGVSWGMLGRLGPSRARLGGVLGASWVVLGASWRRLGGVLARKTTQHKSASCRVGCSGPPSPSRPPPY